MKIKKCKCLFMLIPAFSLLFSACHNVHAKGDDNSVFDFERLVVDYPETREGTKKLVGDAREHLCSGRGLSALKCAVVMLGSNFHFKEFSKMKDNDDYEYFLDIMDINIELLIKLEKKFFPGKTWSEYRQK
ncbi:hypothetical protein FACS1894152_3720 [Bacilli bacterium]|nr:hypothetical protein FACS1894152_3720 [Bacilli bacterium]